MRSLVLALVVIVLGCAKPKPQASADAGPTPSRPVAAFAAPAATVATPTKGTIHGAVIAPDGSGAWALEATDGTVAQLVHVALADGKKTTLLAEALTPKLIAATPTGLVYSALCGHGIDPCIMHLAPGATKGRQLAIAREGGGGVPAVADASAVYFIDRTEASRILTRVVLATGERVELFTRPREKVKGTFLVGSLASDDQHVYWWIDDALVRVPKAGGPALELARGHFANPISDGTHVYWTEGSALRRVPVVGGAIEKIADDALSTPGALTADATHVYWVARGNVVRRRAKTSGLEEDTPIGDAFGGLTVTGTDVYWITTPSGALMRARIGRP